jgi:cytochrome c-type biogenesis protein CcmH
MTWVVLIALTLVVFAAALLLRRGQGEGWEVIAAALMVGLAGYALQGHPGVAAAPKAPAVDVDKNGEAMVAERLALSGADPTQNKWQVIGDALARQGHYADAATILRGAVEADPKNSEAWVALGNALAAHAQGSLSPAVLFAYSHGAQADPKAPGPPFFLGLAMARAGRFEETKALWQALLDRAPAEAPWRKDVAERMARLDQVMAMIRKEQAGGEQAGGQ